MKMMKKMYARLTATVLSACLLFGSIPMETFAGQVTDNDAVVSTVDSRIDDLGERISSDIDLELALEEFPDRESRLALYKQTADDEQVYDDYFAERYDLIKETVSDNALDKNLYIEICKSIVDIADDDVTEHEIVIYKDDIDRYIATKDLSAEEWFSEFIGGAVNDYPQYFYWFDSDFEHACILDEYENAYVISFAAYEDEVIGEENDDAISKVSVSDNSEEADTDTEELLNDEKEEVEETQDVSSDEDDAADVSDDTVSENSIDDKDTVSENEATVDEEVSKDVSTVSENATEGANGYEPELDVIDQVNISKASISVPVQYYTGSQITPGVNEVVVKVGKKVLTYQDFDIKSYSNNIEVGTAKIEIEGKGDYTGIKQGTFKIAKKPADHAVVFNGNGATGGSMSPIKMSAGKSYSLTQNKFKRDSYTFIHWNTRPDDTGTVYNNGQGGITTANTDPNGMLTLYAIWKPNEYKITYHLCGGPNNALNTVTKYTVGSYDIQILAPKESDWKKGYQFGGWYADSKYTVRMNVIKMGTTGDIDLYAKWVPYTYSVRFDANGGSGHMSDMTCSFGIYKNLPANSYKKDGYVFCGWSSIKYDNAYIEALDDKSGLVMYADKESVVDLIPARNDVNGTATLYAVWRDRFDIKYELNGGSFSSSYPHGYMYGVKVALPTPDRAGFKFDGWFADPNFEKKVKSVNVKAIEDVFVYAKWTPNKFSVVYDGNGKNSGTMPKTIAEYDPANKVQLQKNAFARKGYEFVGWAFTKEKADKGQFDLADEALANIVPLKFNETIKLYAAWKPGAHRVEFELNGGSIPASDPNRAIYASGKYDFNANADIALPIPTRVNYDFGGWYGDEVLKKAMPVIKKGTFGDIKLYAKWIPHEGVNTFGISYVLDGGNLDPDGPFIFNYTYSDTQTQALSKAVRDGYDFDGWYKDAAFKTKFNVIPKKHKGDIRLYAKWKPSKRTITFVADTPNGQKAKGNTGKQSGLFGNTVKLNKNKYTLAGYRFVGWSIYPYSKRTEGKNEAQKKAYDLAPTGVYYEDAAQYMFANDVTFYAVWQKQVYTITYKNAQIADNSANPNIYTVDDEIVFKPLSALGGEFTGWFSDAKTKKSMTKIAKGSTGDKVIYAGWNRTQYTITYDINCNDPTAKIDKTRVGYIDTYNNRAESGYRLPSASRKGFTFGGWCTDKACKKVVGSIISSPNVDMTLYAKWEPFTYTIKFHANAPAGREVTGKMADMVKQKVGSTITLRANAFKVDGYKFIGWATTPTGPKVYDNGHKINLPATEGDAVIDLYALWEKDIRGVKPVEKPDSYLNVVDFGAVAGDGTDDSIAFQKALKQASVNYDSAGINTVYVPAGVYDILPVNPSNVHYPNYPAICLFSNVNLIMDNEAVIMATGCSVGDYCVFDIENVDNVHIRGGQLLGERKKHKGSGGESGHGVFIKGSRNITIEDMEICNNWGDGIYLGYKIASDYVHCENITIKNCAVYGNRRSAISLTDGSNITIEGCDLKNASGIAPHCGICIEPNFVSGKSRSDFMVKKLVLKDTTITSYDQGSWECMCFMTLSYGDSDTNKREDHLTADDITIRNCTFNGWFGNYTGKNLKVDKSTKFNGTCDCDWPITWIN